MQNAVQSRHTPPRFVTFFTRILNQANFATSPLSRAPPRKERPPCHTSLALALPPALRFDLGVDPRRQLLPVDAREQVVNLRSELEHQRIEYAQYRAEQEQAKSSAAYRLASRIWAIRNAIGV